MAAITKNLKMTDYHGSPFNIEARNKNQTPLCLGAMFELKNDPNKFHVAICMEKFPKFYVLMKPTFWFKACFGEIFPHIMWKIILREVKFNPCKGR